MSSPQAERLADIRTLFASLDDGERLRGLPLVRAMLDEDGRDLPAADVVSTVARAVDEAIESLDSRARTIVVRCDLGGETHRAVADDLGIGERYFYRERRRAVAELTHALTSRRYAAQTAIESEPIDALAGVATALHNAGRSREAGAVLMAAYRGEGSVRRRVDLALQLARFAARPDQRDGSAHWVAAGRRDLRGLIDSPTESAIAACEFDLVEVRADIVHDDFDRAERRARIVTRRLGAIGRHRHRDRAAAALGEAYICLSEALIMRGSYAEGLALALEGRANAQRLGAATPAREVDAVLAVANARILATGSLARAADDFSEAYSCAVRFSLGRDIAKIAANIALICAMRGEGARSAEFSKTASTVGRHALTAGERVVTSIDLVAAALMRRDIECARTLVRKSMPHANGLMANILTIADAEIHLAGGEAQQALVLVRRAVAEIGQRGNVRFLGSAHRIEAEALAAIGQRSAAAGRISDALECLGKAGHPITLSRAFALSARVTGNRRHRASARELQAGLEAP